VSKSIAHFVQSNCKLQENSARTPQNLYCPLSRYKLSEGSVGQLREAEVGAGLALAVVRPTSGRSSSLFSTPARPTRFSEERVLRGSTPRAAPAAEQHVAAVGDVRLAGCLSGQGAPLSQQVSLLQDHRSLHVSAPRPRPPGAAQHHHPVSTTNLCL